MCELSVSLRTHATASEASQHLPQLLTERNLLTVSTGGEEQHLSFRSRSSKQEVQKNKNKIDGSYADRGAQTVSKQNP